MSFFCQYIDFYRINFVLLDFESIYTFMKLLWTTKKSDVFNNSTSLILKLSKY